MFRPAAIVIDAFVDRVLETYDRLYPHPDLAHRQALLQVARMALSRIARSNAPYHDLDHTMVVTQVGQDILRGKMVRDGIVDSADWVHFVASLLCFAVGFSRNLCPGDDGEVCVCDEAGNTIAIPRTKSNGALWPYFTDRGKFFVRHYFAGHPLIDPERLAANIEYSRFPPPPGHSHDTTSDPGLLRAAHIIGAVADPDFMLKMKALFIELQESGIAGQLGFNNVAEMSSGYGRLFWNVLHPLIGEGMNLLTFTAEGRVWLANLHAHVLRAEHPAGATP
ncbi:MAG: metal-dependent phosphohydrolase [Alphaproteobacteria bacterium]